MQAVQAAGERTGRDTASPAHAPGGSGDVAPGTHACAVVVSDEQLSEIGAAFLASGLRRREKVLYLDDGTVAPVLDRLADDRVPVSETLRSGQLQIVPADVARRTLRSPLREVRSLLAGYAEGAGVQGWSGLRVTGRTPDAAAGRGAEFDAALDELVRHPTGAHRATALCLFDHGRLSDEDIARLRAAHGQELTVPAAYDDGLLRVTETGPAAVRLAGEADHSNRHIITRLVERVLDRALRSPTAPAEIELNLASLRFLDVTGAVELVHAAERFPSSHRLVLSDVRPGVLRVLDRCGAPFAAQLTVVAAESRPAVGTSSGGATTR